MTDNIGNVDTDTTQNNDQATSNTGKTYTQEEFDAHMARMRVSIEKKAAKPYADLGDPNELRALRDEAERIRQEQALKRGEFETILKESLSKKDAEIAKRDIEIQKYKIDLPLVNAAAKFQAVNAEQVKQLLRDRIRLNAEGEVEVLDEKGSVKYDDSGSPFSVDALVKTFLDSSPHFRQPTPATSNTRSSHIAEGTGKVDISKLDMNNPEHRKVYAKYRKENGIA
jgi:hypothetical protein